MHGEAYEWVRVNVPVHRKSVLDVAGRNINGSPRDLFPDAEVYDVLDEVEDPSVNIVADATTWNPHRQYELVLCMGSFEHMPEWRKVFATCYEACMPGGLVVLTMGGPDFGPHSAHGGALREGEFYQSIRPVDLIYASLDFGWISTRVEENTGRGDLYFWGQKR